MPDMPLTSHLLHLLTEARVAASGLQGKWLLVYTTAADVVRGPSTQTAIAVTAAAAAQHERCLSCMCAAWFAFSQLRPPALSTARNTCSSQASASLLVDSFSQIHRRLAQPQRNTARQQQQQY
jgi:hypothetical protein